MLCVFVLVGSYAPPHTHENHAPSDKEMYILVSPDETRAAPTRLTDRYDRYEMVTWHPRGYGVMPRPLATSPLKGYGVMLWGPSGYPIIT